MRNVEQLLFLVGESNKLITDDELWSLTSVNLADELSLNELEYVSAASQIEYNKFLSFVDDD